MAKITHLVVAYNHDTGTFEFDGDGSREWIRTLYSPPTNTYDEDAGDWVAIAPNIEQEAIDALGALGVDITNEHWVSR